MAKRSAKKFGDHAGLPDRRRGARASCSPPFGERFFVWEHREWEAIDLDTDKLRRLGGELWARESRDGISKGEGLVAFRFAPGIEGTQFHPEGDGDGVMAWLQRPESVRATINTYGNLTYERMLRSVDDSERLPAHLPAAHSRLAGPPLQHPGAAAAAGIRSPLPSDRACDGASDRPSDSSRLVANSRQIPPRQRSPFTKVPMSLCAANITLGIRIGSVERWSCCSTGHGGDPILLFPTSFGSYNQNEDFGLIGAIGDPHRLGVVTPWPASTGIDTSTWYNKKIHPADRVRFAAAYESLRHQRGRATACGRGRAGVGR